MAKINRENLMASLAELQNKIEGFKTVEFTYHIQRSWPGVGCISDISTPVELVRAYLQIHDGAEKKYNALVALNMLDGSFPELMNNNSYYGYTLDEWDKEMLTKRNELATEAEIDRLNQAIEILKNNMSEDDKFNADMDMVENLLNLQ